MNARDRQFKNSRWEIHRERCRIDRPAPPPPRTEAVRLAAIVQRLLPTMLRREEPGREALLRQWPRLVGDRLCAACRPGEYRDGMLTIYTRGSATLMRLQRFDRAKLIPKLRELLGSDFRDIRLRLDPDPPKKP